jgi:hypothetical protein
MLDKRHGTEIEDIATAHHDPTRRAIGLAAICLGNRDSAFQHWARAGAFKGQNPIDVGSS